MLFNVISFNPSQELCSVDTVIPIYRWGTSVLKRLTDLPITTQFYLIPEPLVFPLSYVALEVQSIVH